MKTATSSYVLHKITSSHPASSDESLKGNTERGTDGERRKPDIRN